MGISNSKFTNTHKAEQSEPSQLSELGAIINALYALQDMKIEVAREMASDNMLMTSSFDEISKAKLRLDEEIQHIQSETEEQILRYQEKAKAIAEM